MFRFLRREHVPKRTRQRRRPRPNRVSFAVDDLVNADRLVAGFAERTNSHAVHVGAACERDIARMREVTAPRLLLGTRRREHQRAKSKEAHHGPYATIMVGACEAGSMIKH